VRAGAQAEVPPPPPAAAGAIYSPQQLDQLLAPIALYPDDLLGQILMAATYPLDVVQADRWLQDPSNASLRGTALAQALQEQPWDTSVKSLVAYPQVLAWMDNALDWTEAAGDAFLAQQPDVMDAVQRLRSRARAAGTLASTPQQTVTADDQGIEIASPDSGVEYVPVYSPDVAYGPWPYADYPPYDFSEPGYATGTFIAFSILVPFWGWDHCDWRHHRINVDPGVGVAPGPSRVPRRPVPWRHDPRHRGGVPYRDPVTRTRFEGGVDTHSVRSNFRGYYPARPQPAGPSNAQAARPEARRGEPEAVMPRPQPSRPEVAMPRPESPRPAPAMPRPELSRPAPAPAQRAMPRPEPSRPAPAPVERALPPAMESFGRGAEVHAQEQRGFSSRVAPPPAAPPPAAGGSRGRR
jgi:hypothetical protein